MFVRPSSASRIRLAFSLYRKRSHQWRGMYSDMRTTMMSWVDPLGRVFQVSDQWANQLAVWRLNDDERDARQLLGKSAVEVLSCLDVG